MGIPTSLRWLKALGCPAVLGDPQQRQRLAGEMTRLPWPGLGNLLINSITAILPK